MAWGLLLADNGASMCLTILPQGQKKESTAVLSDP